MSWFAKLFGVDTAVDKGLETINKVTGHVASGLDKAVYTDQEKAVNSLKITDMRISMAKSLQDQFTPRAISRRIFAGVVLGNFYLHANLWLVFKYVKNAGMAEACKELLVMELQLASLVMFFYYGYYGVKSILNR